MIQTGFSCVLTASPLDIMIFWRQEFSGSHSGRQLLSRVCPGACVAAVQEPGWMMQSRNRAFTAKGQELCYCSPSNI